jgi:hypothetical protein
LGYGRDGPAGLLLFSSTFFSFNFLQHSFREKENKRGFEEGSKTD